GGNALPDFSPINFINSANGATLRVLSSERAGSIGGGGDLSGVIDLGTTGAVTFTIGNDGLTDVYRGILAGTGTIVKVGAGIQSINQSTNIASTFSGNYRIEGGTLSFNGEPAMGVQPALPTADNITLAGGTFASAVTLGINLGNNRGVAVAAPSGIRVPGSGVSAITINGPLSGSNSLHKSGVGVVDIASDGATFSGNWIVTEGTLRSSRGVALPLGTGSIDLTGGAVLLKPSGSGLTIAQSLASGVGNSV